MQQGFSPGQQCSSPLQKQLSPFFAQLFQPPILSSLNSLPQPGGLNGLPLGSTPGLSHDDTDNTGARVGRATELAWQGWVPALLSFCCVSWSKLLNFSELLLSSIKWGHAFLEVSMLHEHTSKEFLAKVLE